MVSKSNTLIVNSKCSCGAGDSENSHKSYFENKCPNCEKEGTLQIETMGNVQKPSDSGEGTSKSDGSVDNGEDEQPMKVICSNCGSEYCGQDGYDLSGGTRAGLTPVNPNEITEDEDEEVSSAEEKEPTYMSGWEGLCDLLRPLDAEAMIVQRGDYVIVRKIDMPNTAKLWAYEGINVVDDSVTITDYTPEIYNTFVIRWGETFENELEFVFEKHKRLFGERKCVLEAKKYETVDDSEEGDDKKSDDKEEDGGFFKSIADLVLGASEDATKTSGMSTEEMKKMANGESTETEDNTEEVPITTKEEAIQFGLKQVGKAKRNDGHTIELKVIGNQNWMVGEWCHVKLPRFNEDSYMFITKCSFESSPDNEYINSLTLADYPPTLGLPMGNTNEENSEENSDEETDKTEEGTENGTENGTGSDSSQNGATQNGSSQNGGS